MEEDEKPCTEVLYSLIGRYQAGTLPEDEKTALEAHLVECHSCRELLAILLGAEEENEKDPSC